jgi:hypothetical protein
MGSETGGREVMTENSVRSVSDVRVREAPNRGGGSARIERTIAVVGGS